MWLKPILMGHVLELMKNDKTTLKSLESDYTTSSFRLFQHLEVLLFDKE